MKIYESNEAAVTNKSTQEEVLLRKWKGKDQRKLLKRQNGSLVSGEIEN